MSPCPAPLPPIKGFLETSFVDWPGKIASVVFLPGCNFRCPYCHNHRLVTDAESFASWELPRILSRLEELKGWIDGVCVTGGEPTLHEGLPELLSAFREGGMLVKLDTNGSRPRVLRELLQADLVQAVALDLKAPLEPLPYRRNTGKGADPEAVQESLEILGAWGGAAEVRTTVHPDLLSLDELCRLAAEVGRTLGASSRFTPQRCRVEEALDSALRSRPAQSLEEFAEWSRIARQALQAARGSSAPA